MGKAQSKRSVDITTDPKKSVEGDEVAGKVEKIEDIDQKEAGSSTSAAVNGDATSQEKGESSEKKETEVTENDKDLTTEKTAEAAAGGAAAEGSGGDSNVAPNSPESPKEEQKEGGSGTSGAEEISPLADESIKSKSKKDKMKKKWSFRSISFGKKDKQKPAKSEEASTTPESGAATAPVTNGEAEKTEESAKKEEGASGDAAAASTTTETKTTENGDASVQEQQLNGDKTPSPTEEQPKQNETKESVAAAAATVTATETTPAAVAPVSSNNDDTAKENIAEVAATAATTVENVVAASVESVAAATPVTNGNAAAEEVAATTEESNNKVIIPAVNDVDVAEKPHQNGTNGDEHHAEAADSVQIPADVEQIKNKSQIEVNTISADLKLTILNEVVAAELDQTQSQNITTTTSTPSEISHVDDDNDVVATIQSFGNVPSSNEISKEEEEEQVVASIIAAVSETPKTADTDTINLPTTITTNIMTTSIDNEVQVPQQQEQLSGEGVSISNVEKPDTEPSLPPPPLPVSQPPSQVSVFAFKDSTETTTTTTVETTTTTTNNETATSTTTTTNDMETTGFTGPANDKRHSELSEVSSATKEETQKDDKEQSLPEPDSIAIVHLTTPLLLEDAASKDEAFEIIDMVLEKDVSTELPEVEKLSVRFSTKVIIQETIETDEMEAATINDEEFQKVKSEAEQFVAEVTEKAAEFVMQQKQFEGENITDEINTIDDITESVEESTNQETQRLPSPPPPLETANLHDDNDVHDKNEEVVTLSENDHQREDDLNAVNFIESKKKEEQEKLEEEKCLAAPVEISDTTNSNEINFDSATVAVVDASNDQAAPPHIADVEKVEVPIMRELEIDPLVKGTIEIEAVSTAQQSSYGLEDDSSNKDIASAKDLKENVAAEMKTQDLPVTCE